MRLFKALIWLAGTIILLGGCRKSDYEVDSQPQVIRDNGGGTGTVTWLKDTPYLVEGLVFVNDGQTLTIEPGAVIRFKTGQGSASSALIVARGGKIIAAGTESLPIIFTAENDDLRGSVPVDANGLWGGVIVLGNARLNLSSGEAHVEGIPVYEPRGVYGGYDDEDDSGVLQYLSIRHGGTNIGEGNEINGLTLAAVGRKTVVEHIEVISNTDDGIEIFGGTVDLKYISVAFCGDDALDFDLGYRGRIQFVLCIQHFSRGDKLIESDGGLDPIQGIPFTLPVIFNGTFIGRGQDDFESLVAFGRNSGGQIANSVFIEQRHGIQIQYVENAESSYTQFLNRNLVVESNIFFNVENNLADSILGIFASPGLDVTAQKQALAAYLPEALNLISDPGIAISENFFNVFPQGNVYDQLAPLPDDWFSYTSFKGAFYTYSWVEGWTLLHQSGFVP